MATARLCILALLLLSGHPAGPWVLGTSTLSLPLALSIAIFPPPLSSAPFKQYSPANTIVTRTSAGTWKLTGSHPCQLSRFPWRQCRLRRAGSAKYRETHTAGGREAEDSGKGNRGCRDSGTAREATKLDMEFSLIAFSRVLRHSVWIRRISLGSSHYRTP